MSKRICLRCKWWMATDTPLKEAHWRVQEGHCRLSRPIVMAIGDPEIGYEQKTAWPVTRGKDFCGDWAGHDNQQQDKAA